MVSIIMLVHGAYEYTKNTIETLQMTKGNYELIVLDNDSDCKTKKLLLKLFNKGMIDKLVFSKTNTLFAKGNNIAFKLCSDESDKVLLLNSDIDIRNPYWLQEMLENYEKGILSLGVCEKPPYVRVDGYCFLIDKKLYEKYRLDENFEWWWSITKLQAQVLNEGYKVKGVKDHSNLIFHYGGASGNDFQNSKGMQTDDKDIIKWFNEKNIDIIDKIDNDNYIFNSKSKANRIYNKLKGR